MQQLLSANTSIIYKLGAFIERCGCLHWWLLSSQKKRDIEYCLWPHDQINDTKVHIVPIQLIGKYCVLICNKQFTLLS